MDSLIITSTSLRHKYFAIKILKSNPGTKVIFENRDRLRYYKVDYTDAMKRHFDSLFRTEEEYFRLEVDKHKDLLESRTLCSIHPGEINSEQFLLKLSKWNPKCIALYSVSIVRDELINMFNKRLFNIHAGLSPYYRGTATNIWPIIEGKLEYIGMTLHHVEKGIDTGGIIAQARPVLTEDDDTHSMACKNTLLAAELVIKVFKEYHFKGFVTDVKQDLSKGRQYYFKDFTEETVHKLNTLIEQGIVGKYLKNTVEIELIN